jgi:hypothetical protein
MSAAPTIPQRAFASVVFDTMRNRDDVHGVYRRDGAALTVHRGVTEADLLEHVLGDAVVGLHTTSPTHTSRWAGFDLDCKNGDRAVAEQNRAHVQRLAAACRGLGLAPLVEDSNGQGGFHLWLRFSGPVETPVVFRLLQGILGEAGLDCETFPKQARLAARGVGNWLRLPGRHPRRAHWSRLTDGGPWRTGDDAWRLWVAHERTDPARVLAIAGTEAEAAAPDPFVSRTRPAAMPRGRVVVDARTRNRILGYLEKRVAFGLRDGEGRNQTAYKLAAFLTRDIGLAPADAWPVLAHWNAANLEPLDEDRLRTILTNGARYGRGVPA